MPPKKNKKKKQNLPKPTAQVRPIEPVGIIPSSKKKRPQQGKKSYHSTTRKRTAQTNAHKFVSKHSQGYKRTIFRDVRNTKHVNQHLRHRRKYWNNIKWTWKEWYTNRSKINTKFKAVSQYFGQLIRRRGHESPWYKHGKRSRVEYFQEEVLGRKRDVLKKKNAKKSKKKNRLRRSEKPWNDKYHRPKSVYDLRPNTHKETGSQISKLKFIPEKSNEQNNPSKTAKKSRYQFHFHCNQQ